MAATPWTAQAEPSTARPEGVYGAGPAQLTTKGLAELGKLDVAQRQQLADRYPEGYVGWEVTSHGASAAPEQASPTAVTGGCWYADYHFWWSGFVGNKLNEEGFRLTWCASGSTITSRSVSGAWYYGNWGWSVDKVLQWGAATSGSTARGQLNVQFTYAGTDTHVLCGLGIGYTNGTYGHKYSCNINA